MPEKECVTNYLTLPARAAVEIAMTFREEVVKGSSFSWGIGQRPDCKHYTVFVQVEGRDITAPQCFVKRDDATVYCEAVGKEFLTAIHVLYGIGGQELSSN